MTINTTFSKITLGTLVMIHLQVMLPPYSTYGGFADLNSTTVDNSLDCCRTTMSDIFLIVQMSEFIKGTFVGLPNSSGGTYIVYPLGLGSRGMTAQV